MIAPYIADELHKDDLIRDYCDGNIFTDAAPIGTFTPYIVIAASDTETEEGAVAVFDIDIDIYDYDEDKQPLHHVSKRIKDTLNRVFDREGSHGYSRIRIWYRDRETIEESDTNLTRVRMRFDARAIEDVSGFRVSAAITGAGNVIGIGIYDPGATVTIAASPAQNWDLDSWSRDGEPIAGTVDAFVMPEADVFVSAKFVQMLEDVTLHIVEDRIQSQIDGAVDNKIIIDGITHDFDGSSWSGKLARGKHAYSVTMLGTPVVSGIFDVK